MANVLRMWSRKCGVTGARGATGSSIVASFATMKAMAFSDTFGIFCGGEF